MAGTYRRRALQVEAWQNDDLGPAMPGWLAQISTREKLGVIRVAISAPDEQGVRQTVDAQLGDYVVLYPSGLIAVTDPGKFDVEFEAVTHG